MVVAAAASKWGDEMATTASRAASAVMLYVAEVLTPSGLDAAQTSGGDRGGSQDADGQGASRGAAGGARAGKPHTPAAKRVAREAAGPDCPKCGVEMTEPTRRTKGSTVEPTEAQGDHIYPKSKGGDGATVKDQDNIEIICASCNNKKSDKIE